MPSINPRGIQFLAGWTSLRMLDRYGHVRDTEIRRTVMGNADRVERARHTGATKCGHSDQNGHFSIRDVAAPQDSTCEDGMASPTGFVPSLS